MLLDTANGAAIQQIQKMFYLVFRYSAGGSIVLGKLFNCFVN